MRYLARRYGEFDGFNIPDVINIERSPIEKQKIETRKNSLFVSGNVVVLNRVNRLNPRELVRTVTEIRTKYPDKLIYFPFFGVPNDYPALFYLGIDLLDDSPIRLLGNGKCVSEFGTYEGEECLRRNEEEKDRIVGLIHLALEKDRFREVVETHSFSPFSKEILRILDMEYYQFMERFMDYRPKKIIAANIEGLYRPEIVNFRLRTRLMNQTADNLLLIPCSAVKPYSRSKTHRILHSLIHPYLGGIQEVIVTSPLGLVPRELESFFPAMHYDIPVTGHWFGEEKEVLYDLARDYFQNKRYSNVFYVLPEQEGEILDLFGKVEGIYGNLNYENSARLAELIGSHLVKGSRKTKEALENSNMLRYLYGVEMTPQQLSQKNEGNRKLIFHKGTAVATRTMKGFRMMRGLAEILNSADKRVVHTEGIFKGNSLFIPGIKGLTEDVRPGMEVVLVNKGQAVGRGISQISNFDLLMEKKGTGVSDVSYFSSAEVSD